MSCFGSNNPLIFNKSKSFRVNKPAVMNYKYLSLFKKILNNMPFMSKINKYTRIGKSTNT